MEKWKNVLLECKNKELGQYDRKLCLRILGVPSVEILDNVLNRVKSLIMESGCEIPYVVT